LCWLQQAITRSTVVFADESNSRHHRGDVLGRPLCRLQLSQCTVPMYDRKQLRYFAKLLEKWELAQQPQGMHMFHHAGRIVSTKCENILTITMSLPQRALPGRMV
jgi:hypothetical protein